jgi:diguanylate cyclase (GGDEF)-like protein
LARSFAVLLSTDELRPAYRWRLVNTLFGQRRSLVEGMISVLAVELVCAARTAWLGFAALIVVCFAVTAGRLMLTRAYEQRPGARGKPELGSPERWAWRFAVGAVSVGMIWSATLICVFFRFHDPLLQMFVVMVASGWINAASARNAPSPVTVTLQTLFVTVSVGACAAIAGTSFNAVIPVFAFITASASLSMASYMREQTMLTMLSEQRLAEANERLTELSSTDGLTGIGNRRALDAVLHTEWARAVREEATLSLLVIDVDFFKRYNDHYGHPAGDECLRMIASVMQHTLRSPPDFAARFGGEEFVAVLPGTTEAEAREVGERLCQAVFTAGMRHQDSPFTVVTISIGAASVAPHAPDGWKALIDRADGALYQAKNAGRNRVRCASDPRPAVSAAAGQDHAALT